MARAPWAIVDFSDADGTHRREVFREPVEIVEARSLSDVLAAIDRVERHTAGGKYAVGFIAYEAAPALEPRFAVRAGYSGPLVWFAVFREPSTELAAPTPPSGPLDADWRVSANESEHRRAVEEIIEGIRRGDYYQVNYTARVHGSAAGDAAAVYERLKAAQGGGYSAFIDTGETALLSISPELFFRRAGSLIEARPMKGTAARGRWPAEDAEIAAELKASEKERAENVMIVDLLRNDLGRIAIPGTVKVASLFDVERYPTIWQMTSHLTAQVKDNTSLTEVLTALFPCGSVTGAPKIAASKAIARLEIASSTSRSGR
jgi:para-aminobenzoate synthetase/4-amino-4-deoxychorismate lyase